MFLSLLCKSVWTAYTDLQQKQKQIDTEADMCLVQFSNKRCEVSNLTEECRTMLTCLKKKEEGNSDFPYYLLQ
jgi:hypothetical protein